MSHTLVLNADAQPLAVLPLSTLRWEESIKLAFMDRISILEYYPDWEVHSPSITMKVPSVIMLSEYVSSDRYVKFSRGNIFLRDEYVCQYCHESFHDRKHDLSFDHVIPRVLGGKTTWDNIVTACMDCNSKKGSRVIMEPLNAPKKPSFFALAKKRKKFVVYIPHNSKWNDYLAWDESLIRFINIKPSFMQ